MNRQRLTILGATGSSAPARSTSSRAIPSASAMFALTAHRAGRRAARRSAAHSAPRYAVLSERRGGAGLAAPAARARAGGTEVLFGAEALERSRRAAGSRHGDGGDRRRRRVARRRSPRRAPASACCSPTRKRWSWPGRCSCARCATSGATLLPIDSEHNAIFQCLPQDSRRPRRRAGVRRILLTASGGPFRTPRSSGWRT